MRKSLRTLPFALLAISLSTTAADKTAGEIEAIRKALGARFPEVPLVDVRPAQIPGLYEVFSGDNIAYANATGDLLLVGSLMDTRTKTNLTAERLDERLSVDFASLPVDKAIVIVKGNGLRKMAVFTDPDCPFCRKLEEELARVTDITLYLYLYPIESLHAGSTRKAGSLWCADDPAKAWQAWMSPAARLPVDRECPASPVPALQELGEKLHVQSTPTLFMGSGRRVSSALTAEQIEKLLGATAKP